MNTLRIGFFSNAFRQFTLEYAVDALSGMGYMGLELWCKGQHVTPYDNQDRIAYVKGLVSSNNMEVYALSAHLDFITDNNDLRRENIKVFKKVIDLGVKFGVKKVLTASGYLNGKEPDRGMEERFVDSMKELGGYARGRGMIIALEAEPEKLMRDPVQTVEFIDEIGIPVFKTVCDLSHAIALDMTPQEFITPMQDYLCHVHLDDGAYDLHPHKHLIPGEGDVNYREVFEFLEDIKYDDWISVELNQHIEYPKLAAAKAMDFLKSEGLVE
ncbi:MAG: sugar phosphate isomerase/epimerase family protein [Candidatus Hydrothermarchaeales archaeon]